MTSCTTRERLELSSTNPVEICCSLQDVIKLTLILFFSLERVIRDLAAGKEFDRIKKIIQQLCNDFAYAVHQPHARNGGLIGLAAAAIALGPVN